MYRLVGLNLFLFLIHQTLGRLPIACDRQVNVKPGDYCWKIANDNQILINDLHSLNSGLNCDALQPNQVICVAVAKCQTSVTVESGDSCWSISTSNGITLSELQGLNPPGVNCNGLQIGQVICVSRGQGQSATTIKPTQKPQTPSCKSATIKRGDTCWSISSANGITISELRELNPPRINCDALQLGQAVCVGRESIIQSQSPTTTVKPLPSCKSIAVKPGDSCWTISSLNGLTLNQMQTLNEGLNCSQLKPGDRVCIGDNAPLLEPHPKIPTNCKTVYTQEENFTCGEIEIKFGLGDGKLARLNPNYTCCENKTFVLPFGQPLCVQSNGETSTCLSEYVIEPGDTCWSIRVAHRLSEWEFNTLNHGINCSFLIPGKSICISNQNITGEQCVLTMTVQPGDTCETVAQKAGITIQALQNINRRNLNCQNLQAQQVLCVSNDQRFKLYERNDQGPTKQMLKSTVHQILSEGSNIDRNIRARLQGYLAERVTPEEIVSDLSKILGTTAGNQILQNLERTNKEYKDFATVYSDHRSQLCKSLSDSPYKACICDTAVPFLHCQAKLVEMGKEESRRRRDLQHIFQNVTRMLRRLKRSAKGGRKNGVGGALGGIDLAGGNPLQGFFNSMCGGCLSSDSVCLDAEICIPAFVVLEVCLGAGFCAPNPLALIDSDGHITVSQFQDSRVGIDIGLCIVFLNDILRAFGADACIAKGGTDYFYMKQQLTFHGTVSLLVVRGSISGRVQVAEPFTEGVYDTETQTLLEDMCTAKEYQCDDYCQVPPGDVFLEWKVEAWFFGWHNLGKGSKNDPPPCKPKPKKISPPPDSLNRIVLYATSWAQYRGFNATLDEEFVTRPDSCKPHAKTPKDIDPSLVTHLNYAFLVINENTFELVNFEKNDDELMAEMNALKGKNGDLKTLISIGGWSFSQGETGLGEGTKHIFSNMARTEEGRARFIKSAVDYVINHGMDGIDIDWEYPLSEDRDSFTAILRELRSAIYASGKDILLTFAAPAGRKWYSNIDLENVHEYVDFINLMTYDFHGGSFEAGMGPNVNAPIVDCSCPEIEDIELGLEAYLAAGVPSGKINLGLATYGRTFTLDSAHNALSDQDTLRNGGSEGSGKRGVCTLTPGVLSYYEIKELVSDDQVVLDKTLMSAYARFSSNQWVGYDTKETHNMKMCFARRKRLGGLMIWDAEMDDNLELVKNLKANLVSGDCDNFEIPDCPTSNSRKKRAAIRRKPSATKKPSSNPECEKLPAIKNKDTGAMRKCKGTKAGGKCDVVCKKDYKATKSDITCRKVGLKRGIWNTDDVECELDSDDCGSRPYPIIRVADNGGSGATLYYARLDSNLKIPIWSLYVQKIYSKNNPGRVKGFKQHDCFKNSQLLMTHYNNIGFHRGHLSPQDAFSFSRSAMKATNYMINVAPQDGSTNSGIWETLESKVRDFLQDSPGFVVTGLCKTVKYVGKLPVPDCYWKMICTKTTAGSTTVGVFYHQNTKVADLSIRREEVKTVRDQSFVLTKVSGPGRSLADIWTTAAKLSTTVAGLPNPALCATSMSLGSGGVSTLWGDTTARGEDLRKFWDDNIGSDKYGRRWDFDYPEADPAEDEDEDKEDDDEDKVEDDSDSNGDGAGGNVLSGKVRGRCGHDIKY